MRFAVTKQYLRQYEIVDISGCLSCRFHEDNDLFELCKHGESLYRYDGKEDHHTCQHMRSEWGACGPSMKLR